MQRSPLSDLIRIALFIGALLLLLTPQGWAILTKLWGGEGALAARQSAVLERGRSTLIHLQDQRGRTQAMVARIDRTRDQAEVAFALDGVWSTYRSRWLEVLTFALGYERLVTLEKELEQSLLQLERDPSVTFSVERLNGEAESFLFDHAARRDGVDAILTQIIEPVCAGGHPMTFRYKTWRRRP